MTEGQPQAKDGWGDLSPLPAKQEYFGPSGFRWLVPGRLSGTPRPGLFHDLATDLNALARMSIKAVFTLTQEWTPDPNAFAAAGLVSHHTAIRDLEPPTTAQAATICGMIDGYMRRDEAVVFHCHAGKGRTGTLLAAQYVWRGVDAATAINMTRSVNSAWIESESQIDWLHDFAGHCP